MEDLYSDCIRAMYKRYKESDIDKVYNSILLSDFEVVSQARVKYLAEDARPLADELVEALRDEVLYRMGLWQTQAESFSAQIYDIITKN